MQFEDVIFESKLELGKECYLNFEKGKYLGVNENGNHEIEYLYNNELKVKTSHETPTVPKLPIGLYLLKKSKNTYCQLTDYVNFNDKMFYVITDYSDVFNPEKHETIFDLKEKYTLLSESPFKEFEVLESSLNNIDQEITIIEKSLKSLKDERKKITSFCKHQWDKYDPSEVDKNSYEQECVCKVCGEEKLNIFSRW